MKRGRFWIYVLLCENGHYYTGHTADIEERYREHAEGRGARYTRSFPPVRIAGSWSMTGTRGDALKVELIIKGLTRRAKEALLARPEGLAPLVKSLTGRSFGLKGRG